jgi:hypothetical protein
MPPTPNDESSEPSVRKTVNLAGSNLQLAVLYIHHLQHFAIGLDGDGADVQILARGSRCCLDPGDAEGRVQNP